MIGELLAASCDDADVLARIGGPIGEAARDAAAELAALPAADARAWRVRLIAALRSPIPPGIRGVHPTWIETGLTGLPARARDALASGAPDRVDVWLVRWACTQLPPLPPIDQALVTPRSTREALRLSHAALATWLANLGADQLAYALRAKPDALQAIASTLGSGGDRVVSAVRRIGAPPRAGELGPTRDAIERCRGDARSQRGRSDLLIRIGARALAPHTDPLTRRQLAVRLPLALAIECELSAHAATPLDRSPTWSALGAPP